MVTTRSVVVQSRQVTADLHQREEDLCHVKRRRVLMTGTGSG